VNARTNSTAGRAGLVAALGAALATTIAACTVVADIDVCERAAPATRDLNALTEGDQQLAALAALPNGNAFALFFSTAIGDERPLSELRGVLVGGDGATLPTCDAAGLREVTYLTRRTIGTVSYAPPWAASERGLVTWLEDDASGPMPVRLLRGLFLSETGCVEAPPFEIARADDRYQLTSATVLTSASNQFVAVWSELELSGAPGRIRARAVEFSFSDPEWLGNVDSPSGDAATLVDFVNAYSLGATIDGGGTFALSWYEASTFAPIIRFARFDDRLRERLAPVTLSERRPDERSPDVTVMRVAHADGQYLLAYTRRDDAGVARVFGQFVDANGAPLRGEHGDGAFRIGARATAREILDSVIATTGGGFAVTWTEEVGDASAGDLALDVRALLVDGARTTRFVNPACAAGDFDVTGGSRGLQERAIAVPAPGGLLIAWSDGGRNGTDPSGLGTRVRFYPDRALLPLE